MVKATIAIMKISFMKYLLCSCSPRLPIWLFFLFLVRGNYSAARPLLKMIANAVLVFICNAGEGMLHHRFPGDFAENFVKVGA